MYTKKQILEHGRDRFKNRSLLDVKMTDGSLQKNNFLSRMAVTPPMNIRWIRTDSQQY